MALSGHDHPSWNQEHHGQSDLDAGKRNGSAVIKEACRGKLIFGVCGGYQMLGETLSDPHGVENGGSMKGMGLLPMETVFAEKKTRTRVEGI